MTAVRPHPHPAFRDRVVAHGYRALNTAKIGRYAWQRRPWRMIRDARRHPWLYSLLKVNDLHRMMTRGRVGRYRQANAQVISSMVSAIVDMLEGAFAHPDRLVLHEDLVPPEILFGMGLDPWMAEFLGIVLPMIDLSRVEGYIDTAENEGIPADVCSLPKSTLGLVLDGEMPPPVAAVTSNMPCDGGMSQYTLIERKLGVPTFRLDVPHDFYGDRAVAYFAGELRRLIAWLEDHTPGRMDWDRMREICEERNRAMAHELDLWDLIAHRPAPLAAEPVYLSHLMYGVARPGTPRGTALFGRMVQHARHNLERGIAAVEPERFRSALWNPPTMMCFDLFAWAEQQWGVALIMDMLTYHRHPYVDTTSPDTMIEDLARIIMQGPMARHTRGPAENFFGDLFYFYDRFDLDMIWMAGHVGCKNTQALLGMFRERCRERDIPLLIIDYDLSDSRVVPPGGVRAQVDTFMETVMQAEPLAACGSGKEGIP